MTDTKLIINTNALAENYKTLNRPNTECAAVVKADGYGLGVHTVTKTFAKAGCKRFFVAHLSEAIAVRDFMKKNKVYVFHGIRKNEAKIFIENNIIPVINNFAELEIWSKAAKNLGKKLPLVVHIDTGMNRLGFSFSDLDNLYEKLSDIKGLFEIDFFMSHLACADDLTHEMNGVQLNKVNKIKDLFGGHKLSLANSSGIFLGSKFHFEILRPGIALYGGNPTPSKKNPMKNVINLTSRIMNIRTIDSKSTVGYGGEHSVSKGSKIATVPFGYADGYLRSSKKTFVAINGKRANVVGRVSMDMITVDVSNIDAVKSGDAVEIIGDNISIDELASSAGTISYEILTGLRKIRGTNEIS